MFYAFIMTVRPAIYFNYYYNTNFIFTLATINTMAVIRIIIKENKRIKNVKQREHDSAGKGKGHA